MLIIAFSMANGRSQLIIMSNLPTLYFHYLKCGYETAGKLQWQPQTAAILGKSGIFSKEGEIIIKLLKKSSRVQKILISGVPMRFRANKLRATKSKWNSQPVCRFLRQTLICLIFGYSLHLNVLQVSQLVLPICPPILPRSPHHTISIKQLGQYPGPVWGFQFYHQVIMLGFAVFAKIIFSPAQSPAIQRVRWLGAQKSNSFLFLCEDTPRFHYNHKHRKMDNYGNIQPNLNRDFPIFPSSVLPPSVPSETDLKRPASVATDAHTQEDDLSTNLSELISNLPSKVYQNCQRTARVIMLSELEKTVMKSKKLKLELAKKLQEFLPHKRDSDSTGEYTGKTKYFKSLHYSRVRIGQRNFINNILLNPAFKQKFEEIFKEQVYENCQKARKNQNSQVSFEKRKQIITAVINQYQNKFTNFYKAEKKQKAEEIKEAAMVKQEEQAMEQQQGFMNQMLMGDEHGMCMFIVPIVPIPLHPSEYQYYQRSRMMEY